MTVTEINSYDDFKTIINGSEPVVIDLYATWCAPCKTMAPIFETSSDSGDFAGIKFYKVDIDKQEEIAQEVGIRALPTFILCQNGNMIKDFVGVRE